MPIHGSILQAAGVKHPDQTVQNGKVIFSYEYQQGVNYVVKNR